MSFSTITREQLDSLEANAGEINDNRSAVCNGQVIELVSYDDAHVVAVYDAPDINNLSDCSSSCPADLTLITAHSYDDEAEAVRAYLLTQQMQMTKF